jgi:HD superfamily phosphohydrolase
MMYPASYDRESLISDPIHGYIDFTASRNPGDITEQTLVDHPWVQRLRRIHQLQSAWWVYPSAEHTRFQHVLGSMNLAGRAVQHLYPSLRDASSGDSVPSQGYVQCLARIAALLHDVGHGPYGHFFDDHFLVQYNITHEDIGQHIIRTELADIIRGVRGTPDESLGEQEILQPEHVAYLIKRPTYADGDAPRWLVLLRSLFAGVYTVDNMDFVLRDSYMAGHGPQAFDLDRLLHYSFFTPKGLTLHVKGLNALVRFIEARGELFRSLYFHRTVRAIDLTLVDLFKPTLQILFPWNPMEHLDRYRKLTEWSLLEEVDDWMSDADPAKRRLGELWQAVLERRVQWRMACERIIRFEPGQSELVSIFTDPELVEKRVRSLLPAQLQSLAFRADVARHYHRPISPATARLNFIYEPATGQLRSLGEHERFSRLPVSFSVCRLYAHDHSHDGELASALDKLLQAQGDDKTNM